MRLCVRDLLHLVVHFGDVILCLLRRSLLSLKSTPQHEKRTSDGHLGDTGGARLVGNGM